MRVAHLITRLIVGGAQENTLLSCEDLRGYGDEVLLITGPGLGPEGSLEPDARRRDIPLVVLPSLRREIHPLRDVQSYLAIRNALKTFRPDVVHTHSGKAGLLGRKAAWGLGVRAVVHTVHGAPFHAYQGRAGRGVLQACERYAAQRCHKLVSVADALTDRMVTAGIAPREKFITIYSGMEIEPLLVASQQRQATRARLGYTDEQMVVGKVARLFHLKGHDDLIEAAAQLCPRLPNLRFLLVGDGLLRSELTAKIAALGLSDRFQFTGLVPPAEIPALLAATDLVVHCSLREGLARVLPQALIVGRPVVSYDIDGAREVVIPGKTGYLLPPQDIAGLVRAIIELSGSETLRRSLAAAGRALCATRFDHRHTSHQLRQLYEQLLASGRATVASESSERVSNSGVQNAERGF
jgi:glycosyltransferase involved in cell wall biosynthesis